MKLKTLAKTLPLVVTAALCSNANAGVSASAYLEVNDLFIEIDINGDGIADAVNLSDYVTIISGTRETNTSADFNGVVDGDASSVGATADSDAALVCVGPSCGILGLTNNGQTMDGGFGTAGVIGALVADDTVSYALADAALTGSAIIGVGATGFTYADVGIADPTAIAAADATIFNNLLTQVTLQVLSDVDIRFTAQYDAFVDAVITPDITNSGSINATASAEVSFDLNVNDIGNAGAEILDTGFDYSDFAFDFPGLGDIVQIIENDVDWASAWVNVDAGSYQVEIAQDSDVQASLVPEPAALAIFGLGLLGLVGVGRKHKYK